MKIPDFHVSNVSVDETCFIDNLDLLEIIISSLVSQYIDQDITINETLKNKFTAPTIDTSKSPDEQKLQIKNNLPDHQKDLPETTKETIAAVLQAAPPATVEFKEITDSSGNVVEESIEVSAKNDSSGNDTVVSTFSEEDTDTATKVTFEIKQSDDTDVDEDVNDIVIAAGLYLPRSPSSGGNRTIVQRSVESTVRKVVSRMTKHNEGVYPAIANVMESSYDIGGTNLGKMLNTFYMFFVDVTKGTDGLKWSFVYPVEKNSVVTYKSYPLDEVPSNITANVGVTINADYLRKPGIFDITFGDDDSGTSYKTSVDLNPSPQSDDTSGGDTSSSTQPTPIPFDKPGTPFIVINGGDKVNIKDIEKVFDPPDPTPTPSPTVTITHPTPTPSVSVTPSTTIYPTPTPTMTISPSPTITDTQDISTLFKFTKNGTNVDVSINANQMNIVGTSEDIAGFTLAFYVPSDYDATNKVSLVGSFENFQYRYATSNTTQNVLYVTGYSLFSGTSNPVPINRSGDGYMSVLRIAGIRQDYVVSPVNPAHNNVVAVSNREAKLWNLNMAYNASISNGFYVSDMTESHIMLNVDGNMFPEQGVDYFEIELEGIDITGVEDVESNFAGWTLELYGSNKIKVTRGAGVSNMARWSMKRLKLAYRDITGDIKIKDGVADDKKIKSGYLIPEDIRFDNGTAYIQTKNLKDPIKSFLVTAKGDLGSVAVSTFLNAKEWTVEGRYNRRDGYTRIMGYSTKGESYKFTGGEALFTYTNTVRAYRVDPQFPGHAFINALNTNIATMGNVLTGDDLANTSMSRFSWLLDHIAGKPDLPNEETLGEFYLKSDVTFDGRILVNDVVALKQYILGNLEYPSVRPLGVFEVKYTINSIPQEVFQKLSENLPALAARIEEMIYGSSTGKNVIIIGSELETNGEAHIYARVFWRDATLYGDAIMSATKMFDDVSYSLPYNNASQTINLSAADPTGVLAVKHNDGNSFTVYGNGLSNIKYSTYHDSTIRDYSGTITESKYFNDITISGLQSGFDVLYVTGGGRTVAVVVTDTDTGTVDPTPTMSTTISPTPTVTQTITPTPTMTITPTPTMTVTITDSPDKEDEPSGYDYYARLVHVTDTVYLWGPDYPGTSRSYHVLQIKPKQSTPFVAIDVRFTKDVKVKPGDFEITDALSDDFGDFQKNGTSEYNPSTFFFACGYGQVTNLPPDVYTTVLIVKTKDASDELGFSALEASKGTGTGEIALGVRVGDGDVYYSVYTPNVSSSSGPGPTPPEATPTPTSSMTITPTPTMTITPTPTMTVTITDSPDKEDEPSGYDYYARLVHVTDTVYLWGPDYPGTSRSYHVLQIKPKQSTPFVAIDVRFTKDVKVKPGDFEITDALSDDFGDFQKNGTSEYNPSTFFFACGYGQVTNLPPDVYTTVLIVKTKDASDELGFSALEASKGTGTGEIALGVRVGDGDVYYSVYTPNVSTTSRMMVSKLLHSVGTGMDWNNSGDTDQSGSINVLDVVNILRYYADDTTFTQSKRQMVEKYGDVTQDGRVNTLDAVRILSFYAGLDGFDLPQRPVSTVPDSSGSPTFVLSNLATPSAGWTSFKVSIDTTTLNPYEFYVGNDANNPHRASVDRNGDDETKYVKSNSDSRRYQRIRSIELVFSGHVYLGDNTTNDVISKYTSAQQGDRDLGPDHDYMYVYCARTTVGEAKETRVMIVNAHNLITSTSGSLKIPNILFIEGTQTLDDIRGLIDWSKSYIGTTSIYKAKWNPMLQDGTTSAYELTKYTTSTGNTLRDFYWKKKDTAVGASSEHGLFMRYSIDDGNAIFPGGVSKESFTSTPGQGGRLMIDEYYLGNIDGNIEEY